MPCSNLTMKIGDIFPILKIKIGNVVCNIGNLAKKRSGFCNILSKGTCKLCKSDI